MCERARAGALSWRTQDSINRARCCIGVELPERARAGHEGCLTYAKSRNVIEAMAALSSAKKYQASQLLPTMWS
jgi:hypothetical protein